MLFEKKMLKNFERWLIKKYGNEKEAEKHFSEIEEYELFKTENNCNCVAYY